MIDSFVENGSGLVSLHLYEGLVSKWDAVMETVTAVVSSSENPFVAAKSIGKACEGYD